MKRMLIITFLLSSFPILDLVPTTNEFILYSVKLYGYYISVLLGMICLGRQVICLLKDKRYLKTLQQEYERDQKGLLHGCQ